MVEPGRVAYQRLPVFSSVFWRCLWEFGHLTTRDRLGVFRVCLALLWRALHCLAKQFVSGMDAWFMPRQPKDFLSDVGCTEKLCVRC